STEVIAGLAYWSDSYLPLGPLPEKWSEVTDPLHALKHIANQVQSEAWTFKQDENAFLIYHRMLNVSQQPDFLQAVSSLNAEHGIDLNALSVAAINLYAATDDDITALHGVTASHALRILSPYIGDMKSAMRYFWQSLCAAYLSLEAPMLTMKIPVSSTQHGCGWSELFEAACGFKNEHCIKLIFSCHEEYRATGESLFHQVAVWKARDVFIATTDATAASC
ncbi:MAG: questin oxidase family protein, partial [Pseudomonadota bacterium]